MNLPCGVKRPQVAALRRVPSLGQGEKLPSILEWMNKVIMATAAFAIMPIVAALIIAAGIEEG